MSDFTPLSKEGELDFFYEFNLGFEGEVVIDLDFYALLGPAKILVTVKVKLNSFYGRLMLFYTPSDKGKSWYSFADTPALDVTIEPVLGKSNKFELKNYPKIMELIKQGVDKKLKKFIFPKKRSIKIPKGKRQPFIG